MLPKFVLEGYAGYKDEMYKEGDKTVEPKSLDFIGIKEDAPQWAIAEFEEWVEMIKKAKKKTC